jgi:type IV pilus assembly protein PilV
MKNSSMLFLRRHHGSAQRGVALLEVLIAFFVLSIGLLGLAAMQMKTLQFNQGAYQRSQATILANDMLDRMRANRVAALADDYEVGAFSSTGSGTGLPGTDLSTWFTSVSGNLPSGQAKIHCDSDIHYKLCTISICWADRFVTGSGACGSVNDGWELLEVTSQM